jgi:serine protease Do
VVVVIAFAAVQFGPLRTGNADWNDGHVGASSGGPLLNLRGEVIGMNVAILSRGRAGNLGVGFAIPINTLRDLLPDLRRGTVMRGWIGIEITPVTRRLSEPLGLDDACGVLVRSVEPDGPADVAGIEPGDVIVGYQDEPVNESDDLVDMATGTEPGTTVRVEIVRDGEHRTVRVRIERLEIQQFVTRERE